MPVPRWGVPPSGGGTHRVRVLSCVYHMSLCMLLFVRIIAIIRHKPGSPEGPASGKISPIWAGPVIRFAETGISCMAVLQSGETLRARSHALSIRGSEMSAACGRHLMRPCIHSWRLAGAFQRAAAWQAWE